MAERLDYTSGLLHCSSQSKNDYYNNNNYPSNEDKKENIASAGENTPPTSPSSFSSPPSFCPIGGKFVNRDSNAATNIALKFISSRIKNPTSDQQLSLPNLIHGVRIEKKKEIEWVKKKKFLIPQYDVYTAMRTKEEKNYEPN